MIHIINRAQIIDDAFALANSGLIGTTQALAMASYLRYETAAIPWQAFASNIGYISRMLRRTQYYGDFEVSITDPKILVRGQPTILFGTNDLSHTTIY